MSFCVFAFAMAVSCVGGAGAGIAAPAAVVAPAVVAGDSGGGARGTVADDAWLAEDKLRHFAMSFAATQMGYGATRIVLDPVPATVAAATAAFGLGIAKELRDVRHGGPFSVRDLVWDAAGVFLGIALVRQIR